MLLLACSASNDDASKLTLTRSSAGSREVNPMNGSVKNGGRMKKVVCLNYWANAEVVRTLIAVEMVFKDVWVGAGMEI